MPREVFGPGFAFLPREELLTFEEITRVVRVLAGLGVRKVRLTGGEPLLRRDLARLVAMITAIDGIEDLALTTNGVLLLREAAALRAAGLGRVTVSLDALDDATFRAMSDVDLPVARVLEGIDAAVEAGFAPVKVNAVVRRGVNEHAVVDLARYGRERGVIVRFIEYMDVGESNGWRTDDVVPAAEVLRRLDAAWPVEPVTEDAPGAVPGAPGAPATPLPGSGPVAERWRYRDGGGEVGVIASVTRPFCATCTRARLSAVGELYTCLFATRGFDVRTLLRGGAGEGRAPIDDAALEAAVRGVWAGRGDRYSELRTLATSAEAGTAPVPASPRTGPGAGRKIEMSYIGG